VLILKIKRKEKTICYPFFWEGGVRFGFVEFGGVLAFGSFLED
jgi:hypothetical protein